MMFLSHWHGLTGYNEGEIVQKRWADRVRGGHGPVILGFEFQPVITIGKRGRADEDLKTSEESIRHRGWEVAYVDRGGHATLHNPGQLVIYPVASLHALKWGVRDYICWLQKTTRETLASIGIESFEGDEPGLYTKNGKIAFFGVRIAKGITQHGLSVNVSNDLGAFSLIRSCGRNGERFDCVASYRELSPERFFQAWIDVARHGAWQLSGCHV